jgi:hypothetical protein
MRKKLTTPELVCYRNEARQTGFFGPIPRCDDGNRNADVRISFLDADAQL